MSCDQQGCSRPQDLTVRLDCGHFVCPTCLPALQGILSEEETVWCSKCSPRRCSPLTSVLPTIHQQVVTPFMQSAIDRAMETIATVDKFEGEAKACFDKVKAYTERALDPEISDEWKKEIMDDIRSTFEGEVETTQDELLWIGRRTLELLKCNKQLKRKTMESGTLNAFHWLMVYWGRISESPMKRDILHSSFTVNVEERIAQNKAKTFDEWRKDPGFLWLFTIAQRAPQYEQIGPFEILESKQRVAVIDDVLKPMPLPLIKMVGSLFTGFAGYLTKRMTVVGLPLPDLSCWCDDIYVSVCGSTMHFWDVKQMCVRGVVELPCEFVLSLCYVGQDTVAIGSEDGDVMFVNSQATNDSDLKHSFTRGHSHRSLPNALVLLRDGRLVSGSADRLLVWRRTGASWHDDIVLDLVISLKTEEELEEFEDEDDPLMSLVELSDGALLCGSSDGRLGIFSLADGSVLKSTTTQHRICFLAPLDGERVASVTFEGIQIWSTTQHELRCLRTIPLEHKHEDCSGPEFCSLVSAAYCGQNVLAIHSTATATIHLYDIEDGTLVQELPSLVGTYRASKVEYVDGRRLIVYGTFNKDHIYDGHVTEPAYYGSWASCLEEWR